MRPPARIPRHESGERARIAPHAPFGKESRLVSPHGTARSAIDPRAAALHTGTVQDGRQTIHRAILTGFAAAATLALTANAPARPDSPPAPNAADTAADTPAAQPAAQPDLAAPDPDEMITVEAPRSIKRPAVADSHAGAEFLSTTVRIGVLYSDLDLTKDGDAERLMKRVERVANDACTELDRVYPLDPDPECVPRATGYGRKAARAVIDAARAAAPGEVP